MQKSRRSVLIEGYSAEEILGWSNEQLDQLHWGGPNCSIRVVSGLSVEAIEALIRGWHRGSELGGRAGDSTGRSDRGVLVVFCDSVQ